MISRSLREYEMRDVRTNSIVNEDENNNHSDDSLTIRNEIILLSDLSLNQEKPCPENTTNSKCLLYMNDYFKNPEILQSFKLPELRSILRFYKEDISFKSSHIYSPTNMKQIKVLYDFALNGSKQKIIDRIIHFFLMNSKIVNIQKRIRGSFVRQSLLLRGPALKNRSICVNETDFFTMEPLNEIEFDKFFSYRQETPGGNYIYGFDHNSLIELLKTRPYKYLNPYNREEITSLIPSIRKLERLQNIIVHSQRNIQPRTPPSKNESKPRIRSRTREMPLPPVSPFFDVVDNPVIPLVDRNFMPAIYPMSIMLSNIGSGAHRYDIPQMINKIRAIRVLPFSERAQSLFMEIDQLGNYTQVAWFTNLNRREYMRYYRFLHDIWSYRAQMSNEIKRKICPMWDPFSNFTNDIIRFNILTDDEVRCLCIRTMEDIIYTGIDREFRVLGTFHVLSALTIVSLQARQSMPWLYESVML
jgi:hypothetical protein